MPEQTEKKLTGYPSIDKPWLKYYPEAVDMQEVPSPDCSMVDFLRQCNAESLDLPALNYFGAKTSYKNLFETIERTAAALQKHGVKKGDFVSLCGLNTPEFVVLLYAVNKVGAVSNWLGLTSPVSDLKEQFVSTGTKLVFAVDLAYNIMKEAAQDTQVQEIISVPLGTSMPPLLRVLYGLKNRQPKLGARSWNDFLRSAEGSTPQPVEVKGNDLAMLEYTGGSTGVPKGVMLSNKNLNSYYINFIGSNCRGYTNYRKGERFLACVPLFLAFGVSTSCHGCLAHSLELVLAPDPKPEALGKLALRSNPNHIIAGRVQIDGIILAANRTRKNLSYIHSVMYGGEAANKDWERESEDKLKPHHVTARLLNGYAMTETTAAILFTPLNTSGGLIPFEHINVKITDPDDPHTEFGYDTEGELCLSSDTVMMGYFQKEAETEKVIFEENGQRWLRTQDLAMISTDGRVHITGRIKRIYHKLSPEKLGVRVYPMRIEECISEEPEIEKCAVVGIKDDKTAYRTIAYLMPKAGNDDRKELEKRVDQRCRAELPGSHVPDEYIFTSDFPLTRAGKIDYRALEEMAASI